MRALAYQSQEGDDDACRSNFACVDPSAPCVDDDSVTVDMLEKCDWAPGIGDGYCSAENNTPECGTSHSRGPDMRIAVPSSAVSQYTAVNRVSRDLATTVKAQWRGVPKNRVNLFPVTTSRYVGTTTV